MIRYKVNLILLAYRFAILISGTMFYDTHINLETTNTEFIVYNIFHDMVFLLLSEIKNSVANTNIGKIILSKRVDILLSLNVISNCFLYEE